MTKAIRKTFAILIMAVILCLQCRTARCQSWFGTGVPITNAAYSSCVATTYTTIHFPGAAVQLVVTNGNTQMTNSFSSSFQLSGQTTANTANQLPSTFNAGGATASAAAPWTTNISYGPTDMVVPVYWYFSSQPLAPGFAPGSNYQMQATSSGR